MTPGEVTAWVPSRSSRAALESCPPDPRPLSVDQLGHLAGAADLPDPDPSEAPWIGFSCVLPGAQQRTVAATLASLFDRHESLRCDYVPGPGGLPSGVPGQDQPFVRRLLPAGVVEFEPVPLGRFGTAAGVHAALADHLARAAGPRAWPHAGFVTVETGSSTRLYAAFDHVTFDGYSAYAAADEVPLLHRVFATADAPDPALALTGSHLDHAAVEDEFARSLTAQHPLLDPWRDLIDRSGRVPGLPSASGVRRGDRWAHDMVSLPVATPGESAELAELCRAWGVPTALGFVALLLQAIAALERSGPTRIATMMSTHGRRSAEHRSSLGWFAGVAPMAVDVDPTADLRDATYEVARAWERSAPASRVPLGRAAELLGTPLEPGLVISFMDSMRCPGWRDWTANESRLFLGDVPRSDQMHAWINTLPTGTFIEARHPDLPACAQWTADLSVTMRQTLLTALDPRHALVPAVRTPGD